MTQTGLVYHSNLLANGYILSRELNISLFSCLLQKNSKVVSIDSYEDVPVNNENALKKAVANQPISIAIEAGGRDFQLYESVSGYQNLV